MKFEVVAHCYYCNKPIYIDPTMYPPICDSCGIRIRNMFKTFTYSI